jgi:alpha-ribazole phosphatase
MTSLPFPIALVRHTQPDIAPGVCYGRLDIGLTPAGHAAILPIITQLATHPATAIWTSPAQRCRILAELLGAARHITPHRDPNLLELDFGAWEGRPWAEIPRPMLDAWAASPLNFAPPNGETGAALLARVNAVHAALIAQAAPCIVIAHGGPLKLLIALLRGATPDLLAQAPPLGSVTLIENPATPMPASSAPEFP